MTNTSDSNKRLMVLEEDGERHPFLRGMVTHELLQRGLTFEDAYAIAKSVRTSLSSRGEVTAAELRATIDQELEASLGHDALSELSPHPTPMSTPIEVVYQGEPFPFSRGVLARSLVAAGLDPHEGYDLALAALEELRLDSATSIGSEDLATRVASLLETVHSPAAARRYRLMRSITKLPKPLVIYIAGASGTGKSTLSFDLAPLLRIYRLTSTDSIRQVMRMVFSPAIMPSLHRSSFEPSTSETSPSVEESTASFEEQAKRVSVGVRAVVERSIAENTSVIVEGVHLLPPLVPFPDLEGQAYQLMLMLETRDRDTHRSHFVTRTQAGKRHAARYLEHFESIRSLQNLLLERAEEADIPSLDTTDREATVHRALRLVTDQLTQKAPLLGESAHAEHTSPPALLLILDGLGDQPVRALGGRTPLEAARTPVLDRLAREGRTGFCDPVAPGVVPDTASGNLALFGQPPGSMRRGPIEAIGSGLELREGDIALRANFATLNQDGLVIDRRAGRIRLDAGPLAQALNDMSLEATEFADVSVQVKAGTEHRLAIALRGSGLSAEIQGSDPGGAAIPGPRTTPRALDREDPQAERTARLLDSFESQAHRLLQGHPINEKRRAKGEMPANCLLTRGAGVVYKLAPVSKSGVLARMAAVAGDRTVLGIAKASGATLDTAAGMTANLDTDLDLKFERARSLLADHDVVVLHVKGADIAAHDRRPDLKTQFIEKVDAALGKFLKSWSGPLRIAVSADHTTLVDSGQHSADPVPALIWGPGIEPDEVTEFHERAVSQGALQRFPLQTLLTKLLAHE